MTISASNLTLTYLLHDSFPPVPPVYHILNRTFFLASHVVKLKHERVIFTTINTGMGSKIFKNRIDYIVPVIVAATSGAFLMFELMFLVPIILRNLFATTTLRLQSINTCAISPEINHILFNFTSRAKFSPGHVCNVSPVSFPIQDYYEFSAPRIRLKITLRFRQDKKRKMDVMNTSIFYWEMMSRVGIEPTTRRLRVCCSTN